MQLSDPRIKERIIAPTESILFAFKKMDAIYQKLLIILDGDYFMGLISAGDIQRAIIKNTSLDKRVTEIIRSNPRLAYSDTDMETIRKQMLEHRMEFMPVVNKENHLIHVFFWEDLFGVGKNEERASLKAKVVIMAGGVGSRLKPLTNVIPKPLIPIGEKSIIENIIDNFINIGSNEFILSINYKSDLIEFYFDQIENKKYLVEYIHEKKPFGTAGSLKLLEGLLTDTFFVTNCDILIDQDYRDVWNYHKDEKNELTLVSSLKCFNIPYGTLKVGKGGKLIAIDEKPTLSYFINAGMYVIEPHLLKEIPGNIYFNITDLIDIIQKRNGKIGVFPVSEGSLKDLGNWDEYLKYIL
jgi:dTDP-glucose pyrophosphorylase